MKKKKRNRLSFRIKLFFKGKLIFDTRSSKKRRILYIVRGNEFDKAHLRVVYSPNYTNEGIYTTECDLIDAINSFSE